MSFEGFDEEGSPKFDSKESAIAWARKHLELTDPGGFVMIHREWVPLCIAHLVQGTWFEWIAYYKAEESI